MSELVFIILFFAWYILSLIISERVPKNHVPGPEWTFFLCMVLSPVTGFLIVTLKGKSKILNP